MQTYSDHFVKILGKLENQFGKYLTGCFQSSILGDKSRYPRNVGHISRSGDITRIFGQKRSFNISFHYRLERNQGIEVPFLKQQQKTLKNYIGSLERAVPGKTARSRLFCWPQLSSSTPPSHDWVTWDILDSRRVSWCFSDSLLSEITPMKPERYRCETFRHGRNLECMHV